MLDTFEGSIYQFDNLDLKMLRARLSRLFFDTIFPCYAVLYITFYYYTPCYGDGNFFLGFIAVAHVIYVILDQAIHLFDPNMERFMPGIFMQPVNFSLLTLYEIIGSAMYYEKVYDHPECARSPLFVFQIIGNLMGLYKFTWFVNVLGPCFRETLGCILYQIRRRQQNAPPPADPADPQDDQADGNLLNV